MTEAPWSRDELMARLQAVLDDRYHDRHPFHVRMHLGQLNPDELRGWILNRFQYQRNIPVKDAFVLAALPSRDDRRLWLQRIVNHDGRSGDQGGIEAWLRLGEAAGLERETLLDEERALPGVRLAVDGYVNFCRLRPWVEAVASSLTELQAPRLMEARVGAFLRHYAWVQPEGLEYFNNRLSEAPQDVEHAIDLVVRGATTREVQERCVAALRFKCEVLWSLLDAVESAYTHRRMRCPAA